uniref:Sperm surface protein Sp17 n=1 Tax=Molossus molossus TaxID=27622 RepID=A0A7J8BZW0_MOLMO|nr:sperm autoantigenic protein 17 [Molossus molossus]
MSVPFSNTHYRIPQGFGNLLEGLTCEILREQPDNIPSFAAAYFENLLEKREKKSQTPVKEETPVTALESSEEDKEKEEQAAVKIQAIFRGHLAREEVKKMKQDDLEGKTKENN